MSKLTTSERNALPDSAFADPAHRAYPMQDAGHRQAALGMVAAHGTPHQKAQVHAKAKRAGYLPTHDAASSHYGGDPLEEGR